VDSKKLKIIESYLAFLEKHGTTPTRADLAELGASRDGVRGHFGSMLGLKKAARKARPKSFEHLIDDSIFSRAAIKHQKEVTKQCGRFVITTAVVGCRAFKPFLDSIKNYCKKNDAQLLILSAADPMSVNGWTLDSHLGKEHIVLSDLALNSNVFISTIKLSAKHVDPTTGLDRIGQRSGSFIYGSPKQRLKFVATGNEKAPHAIMTTGAITLPSYVTENYNSDRTAYIANHDHIMGAVVVEIEDDTFFHFRQIQADTKGGFVDLDKYYLKDVIKTVRAEAFSLGDWHSGETESTAKSAWKEICSVIKPKCLILHDVFNGLSINHHEKDNLISLAKRQEKGLLNLELEIRQLVKDLDELSQWPGVEQVVISKSNHDVFLDRWLQSGDYHKDKVNMKLGSLLAHKMICGSNPLQFAVEYYGLKNKDKVRWLDQDEPFRVAGVELGVHGDIGSNGKRNPGMLGLEKAYGRSTTAHAHTPEILRQAYRVGTSSILRPDFVKGASSWVHCSSPTYSNGSRTLLNSFGGKWRLKGK